MLRNLKCPACDYRIQSWEVSPFTRRLCIRCTSPCPKCGISLIYDKWPWRLTNLGALLMFGTILLPAPRWLPMFELMYFGGAMMAIGAVTTTLEELDS